MFVFIAHSCILASSSHHSHALLAAAVPYAHILFCPSHDPFTCIHRTDSHHYLPQYTLYQLASPPRVQTVPEALNVWNPSIEPPNDICRCIPLFTSKMSDKTSDWQLDDVIGASNVLSSARTDARRHPFFSFPHHLPLLSVRSRTPHSRCPWGDTRRNAHTALPSKGGM